ncbi:hypothetical protein KKY_2122 [Pelagibacterium halotolerans B2]|uniref:Uncharacterized protein n=1 Tax=Pelagibacterium halotolerans (strain DSM 22347 / JCM 15775 / CGMCC 1.7692 / B2) TaxID=1082931 RepID=G4RGU2_PELHB|nr:hypothetical protein KKY_2122 [Pelagibacterium halotolerans B2]
MLSASPPPRQLPLHRRYSRPFAGDILGVAPSALEQRYAILTCQRCRPRLASPTTVLRPSKIFWRRRF